MTPIVDGLEEQYQGQIAVRRIDASRDDGPKIVREYNILGHPAIILFDQHGNEQSRLLGPQKQEEIASLLEQLLDSTPQ
jgi:thioredoxin-like negative regulator of GroEL